jgi:kelch-like protein 24/35
MYVLGGILGGAASASVLKFDSARGVWSQVVPMPAARCALAACAVGSGIYTFGGRDADQEDQTSVFKYNTVANTWSALAPMPVESSYHSASVLDGLIYIVGAGELSEDVLRFDPASGV